MEPQETFVSAVLTYETAHLQKKTGRCPVKKPSHTYIQVQQITLKAPRDFVFAIHYYLAIVLFFYSLALRARVSFKSSS
jgi:hypothetical protein